MSLRPVALVCTAVCLDMMAAREARAAQLKIGVVNVREVFARYKKAEDLQKEDEKRLEPQSKELERRQRELVRQEAEILQKRRDQDKEGGAEQRQRDETDRLREAKELEYREYLFSLEYRRFRRDVRAANERRKRRLWEDLAAACRRVADAEGYDLVLRLSAPGRSATSDRERLEALQGAALLYAAPSIDMTQRVLEVLENAYRRGIKLVPDEVEEPLEGGHG